MLSIKKESRFHSPSVLYTSEKRSSKKNFILLSAEGLLGLRSDGDSLESMRMSELGQTSKCKGRL